MTRRQAGVFFMKKHYIYLPGLGEGLLTPFRRALLWLWRLRGMRVTFVEMRWNDTAESWQQKYQRLVDAAKEHENQQLILIGESAGGAMALQALSKGEIDFDTVVTVCGYNHGASGLADIQSKLHPAFVELVKANDDLQLSSDHSGKLINLYSEFDQTVRPERSLVDGARHNKLPKLPHMSAITYILLVTIKRYLG